MVSKQDAERAKLLQKIKNTHIAASIMAVIVLGFAYACGFILSLGNLAMHGPKSNAFAESGIYGSLAGGAIGVAALIRIYRLSKGILVLNKFMVIVLGWALWVAAGLFTSRYVLSLSTQDSQPLWVPIGMVVTAWAFMVATARRIAKSSL